MRVNAYSYCCKASILTDFEHGEAGQENDYMSSDELDDFKKAILREMHQAKLSGKTLITAITTTPEVNAARALEELGWQRCGDEVHAYPQYRDSSDTDDDIYAEHMLQLWMTPLYDRNYQQEIDSKNAFKNAVSLSSMDF
jgi:hypothetical protein